MKIGNLVKHTARGWIGLVVGHATSEQQLIYDIGGRRIARPAALVRWIDTGDKDYIEEQDWCHYEVIA